MKIAFVLDGGFTSGGAERVAARLLDYWAKDGRHIDVITKYGPAHDFHQIPTRVNRIVIGDAPPASNPVTNFARMAVNLYRLRQAIKNSHAHVVVSFLTITNLRTITACIGLGKRVIVSERNDVSRQHHPWPVLLLRRILYRYAAVVTANSHNALESLRNHVPTAKLAYLPNPIEFPEYLASPEKSCIILNVARLASHKAQFLLIEAFASLDESRHDWQIEILGEGTERANLERLAIAYELGDAVALRGLVADPSPHYLEAGIFVLPSIYEGTPNALLEAMAHGLPSIVSDTLPGALEHIEDGVTGLVFRGGDKADLAIKLSKLMTDPALRERLGRTARERMQRFTPERVMQEWDTVLYSDIDKRIMRNQKS